MDNRATSFQSTIEFEINNYSYFILINSVSKFIMIAKMIKQDITRELGLFYWYALSQPFSCSYTKLY